MNGSLKLSEYPGDIFYVNFRHVRDREQLVHSQRVTYHLAPDWRDASKIMATDVEIVR
jgi:hypothetical protein